jgi:hypothetical protein
MTCSLLEFKLRLPRERLAVTGAAGSSTASLNASGPRGRNGSADFFSRLIYVQPRRRKIRSRIGIGIPNSQSKMYPVAPVIGTVSFNFMLASRFLVIQTFADALRIWI